MGIHLGNNIIPIAGMGFVIVLTYLKYRAKESERKEKLNLIEKGLMDQSALDAKPKIKPNGFKTGLMLLGVAFGILSGYSINLILGIPEFVSYSTSILIICGLLLLYFHKTRTE